MTTDITELAQLRADLSNPAIGSKDHLRKLALLLIDELEESRSQITKHEDFIREQDQLIAVLKRNLHASMQRTVTVKLPKRSVGEVMHMSGFGRDYAEGWCAGNDNAIHEISNTAGIMVEDE
ncbi:Uncharacterised protein [Klebsiella pneumoniae]|nr:Uncharacterised protein [Klebsiella pneumoniae]